MRAAVLAAVVAPALGQASVSIDTTTVAATIAENFVSFGWEMRNMMEMVPYLSEPTFRNIASHLSPATVRVGGITGDWTLYTNDSEYQAKSPSDKPKLGGWPTTELPLSTSMFKDLTDFMRASNMSLLFMLNELHGRDCHTYKPPPSPGSKNVWCVGEWDTSNMEAFLQYLHDTKQVGGNNPTYAFELGNELISHLDPATNVADIKKAAQIIQGIWSDLPMDQRPGLFAPSTDACSNKRQMEIMRNISDTPGVAGFTFHAYPGGGVDDNPNLTSLILDPEWLGNLATSKQEASKDCLDTWNSGPRASGLQLLLTEASASWQWNRPPPAQDSFLHTLFTIAELGQYAKTGVGFVARWALSEATRFATIRRYDDGSYGVAADYWPILAHKRLTGSKVLSVETENSGGALVYAGCGKEGNGTVVLHAVNTAATTVTLHLSDSVGASLAVSPRLEYIFTAGPDGDLATQHPTLNGAVEPLRIESDGGLPVAFAPAFVVSSEVQLPPRSSAVILLLEARAAVCSG